MDIAGALSIRTNFCQAYDLAGQGRISQNFGFKPAGLPETPGLAATLYTGAKALAIYTPVITIDRLLGTDMDNLVRNSDQIAADEITKSAASFDIKSTLKKVTTLGLFSFAAYKGLHYAAFHYLPTDLFKHFVTWGAAAAAGLGYLGVRSKGLQNIIQDLLRRNISAAKQIEIYVDESLTAAKDSGKLREKNASLDRSYKRVSNRNAELSSELDLLSPIVDNLQPDIRTRLANYYLNGLSEDEGVVPSSSIERLLMSVDLNEHPELKKSLDKKKASEVLERAKLHIAAGDDEQTALVLLREALALDPDIKLDEIDVETCDLDEKNERVKVNLGSFFRAKSEAAAAEHAPPEPEVLEEDSPSEPTVYRSLSGTTSVPEDPEKPVARLSSLLWLSPSNPKLKQSIPELFQPDGNIIKGEEPNAFYRLVKREGGKVYVEFDNNTKREGGARVAQGYDIIEGGDITIIEYRGFDRQLDGVLELGLLDEADSSLLTTRYRNYPDVNSRDYNFYIDNLVLEKAERLYKQTIPLRLIFIAYKNYQECLELKLSEQAEEAKGKLPGDLQAIKDLPQDSPFRDPAVFVRFRDGLRAERQDYMKFGLGEVNTFDGLIQFVEDQLKPSEEQSQQSEPETQIGGPVRRQTEEPSYEVPAGERDADKKGDSKREPMVE